MAKSTWERIDTVHDIVYGLEPLIVFYGATATDVEQHFDWVKGELEDNMALRLVYGDMCPSAITMGNRGNSKRRRKWNSRMMTAANGVTVMGRGAGKGRGFNVRSRRPTKVVIDDGETDDMVRSSARREKFWRWITEVIEPSLDKERGRLKIIGTVIHPKCAVLRFFRERGGIFRRAIEEGRSIWPEYWTLEALIRKRDGYVREDGTRVLGIGTRAFSQEYQNEPIGDGLTMFRQSWLDDNAYETLPPRDFMRVVLACDPAAGEGSGADDYGLCAIGRDRRDGKRYVLEASLYHGGVGTCARMPDGTVVRTGAREWFHSAYERWQPDLAGVEANNTVQAFWQLVRDSGDYRVRKLRPSLGQGGRSASKEERAKLVEPLMEQGVIRLNPRHADLYDQLLAFPTEGVKDDVADSFFHANSMLDGEDDTIGMEVAAQTTGTSRIKQRKF
jgi:hypothetical protein